MPQLPPPGPRRTALFAVVVASVISGALALWDINRRPDELVRGRKFWWRTAIGLNSGNSLAYWVFGRRREPTAVEPS